MTRLKKTVLPFALVAAMLHGLVLSGCGGTSSPTASGGDAEVKLRLSRTAVARVAVGGARSAAVSGATVFVDGVAAGVTDSNGEIVLQIDAGTHTITVSSGGVTSSAVQVSVAEGTAITLDVEIEADGTLAVEQDTDRDGDVDDNDGDDPEEGSASDHASDTDDDLDDLDDIDDIDDTDDGTDDLDDADDRDDDDHDGDEEDGTDDTDKDDDHEGSGKRD
jgi:hypothetical protein